MNVRLHKLEKELASAREKLLSHPLYEELNSVEAMRIFMEQHVFAVWDFMSLLKSLQQGLTCTNVPWVPKGSPKTRRFINEIVLGEESDLDREGVPASHYELYLQAMRELGANTSLIEDFVASGDLNNLNDLQISQETKDFVDFTFEVIHSEKLHLITSVFTFGREDIIPEMFIEIVKEIEQNSNTSLDKLKYYLQRHIEIDGDEHGPISLNMVNELCGEDEKKWSECAEIALKAIEKRIQLWDGVMKQIQMNTLIHQQERIQ
ncbi:MAG: hypothetical protein RIT43_1533 [Bacteroidota bacterium]|jgi:hypothetical protein